MALIHSSLPIVSDNLILYLDAANPKSYSDGDTTWSDMLGGNDITLTGGPSFDSTDGGGSIVFDGSDDQGTNDSFSIDNIDDNGGSLEVWCKITDTSSYRHIAGWRDSDKFYMLLLYNNGSMEARADGAGSHVDIVSSDYGTSFWADNWNQIVLTLNRSDNKTRFYLNGSLVDTSSSTVGAMGTNNLFELMKTADLGSATSAGKLSQVRVYSGKVLSAAEVKQNYDAVKIRFGL